MHPNVRRFGVPAAAAAALLAPLVVAIPAQAAEVCTTDNFGALRYGMTMARVEALMHCSGVVTSVQTVKNGDGSFTVHTFKRYAGPGPDVSAGYKKMGGASAVLYWMARS